jgi:hypothetical protein
MRPLVTIPVGVLVERLKGVSPWTEFTWRPAAVLVGAPEAPEWSKVSEDSARTIFYAGMAEIELYRTETQFYRDNLESVAPKLWISLHETGANPPYRIATVSADPAEGESLTEIATALVESVPMPAAIQESIAAFIAEHHVEQTFIKRQRDRADPETFGRYSPQGNSEKQ